MKCENCGETFEPKRKTARYCSDKCRVYAKRNTRPVKEISVTKPSVTLKEIVTPNVTIKTKPKDLVKMTAKAKESEDWKFCQHGFQKNGWSCRKGCK